VFSMPEVRAVLCARGGYGCLRLLPSIDWSLVRADPKIIMGYSDITALLWGLCAAAGLACFHGPVVKGLERPDAAEPLDLFLEWAGDPSLNPETEFKDTGRAIRAGRASGLVFGGNLCLISHLVGTPFMPDLRGAILFLEDTGEPLYRIDRMLTHLSLAGVLDGLSGVVAGDFGEGEPGDAVHEVLAERLYPLGIPAAAGFPVGHDGRNIPLPVGLPAVLDTGAMRLSYTEPCVSAR
jgi:muramoyltetrapeptide carboxypeptidase